MQVSLEKVLVLKNIPVFMEVPESALCDFISVCEELAFAKGKNILSKGQNNRYLYIIVTGTVQVTEKEAFYEIGSQELFGQITALNPSIVNVNVVALEDTVILRISSKNLYEMMFLHPSIAKGIIKTLANKLKVLDNRSI